jgi:glycerol-3-phosphate dehydrogenase
MGKRRERSTYEMPIGGGKEYPQTEQKCNEWLSDLSKLSSLPIDRLSELFDRYGTLCKPMAEWISLSKDELLKNSTEYTIREIQYLVKEEKTVHLDDLALRRTSLGMRGMLTRELAQELASIMGAAIGWDKNQQDMEVERLGSILEDRNRVKLK